VFSYAFFDEFGMLGVCDLDVLEKHLSGETDVYISKEFYGKNECGEEEILKLIEKATNINCFGNKIVDLLIKNKIIDEKNVILIDGVKHAQIYKI